MRKRITDSVLALAALPFALGVSAIASIAIRLESAGSPLFAQERVGAGGATITVYKLRTMRLGTPNAPSHSVQATSITRVGGLLRSTKIDELPQVWNVLRGDMSFVGPRPCLPSQKELIGERNSRGLRDLRPGITGPGQLSGLDMSTPIALAKADATYLQSPSLLVDLRFIVRTALGRGSGDAATKSSLLKS